MYSILFVVIMAMCVDISTSFAPRIRCNVNTIATKTIAPCTTVFCASGPPELQSNDEEPQGRQLSGTMREKMKRELQNNGADPNYSAGPVLGNPILLISGVIAILVILGGKGYFF